jgi:hypothetical protein
MRSSILSEHSYLAIYRGLTLFATLRRRYVLAAVPAWIERSAAAVSVTAGVALFLVALVFTSELARETNRRVRSSVSVGNW